MTVDYKSAITSAGISIYDPITIGDPNLWIPSDRLQILLESALQGLSLEGFPLRTRSKVIKSAVCNALGYPVPKRFKKSKPRFPGQQFDTYVQKSNNLQNLERGSFADAALCHNSSRFAKQRLQSQSPHWRRTCQARQNRHANDKIASKIDSWSRLLMS